MVLSTRLPTLSLDTWSGPSLGDPALPLGNMSAHAPTQPSSLPLSNSSLYEVSQFLTTAQPALSSLCSHVFNARDRAPGATPVTSSTALADDCQEGFRRKALLQSCYTKFTLVDVQHLWHIAPDASSEAVFLFHSQTRQLLSRWPRAVDFGPSSWRVCVFTRTH